MMQNLTPRHRLEFGMPDHTFPRHCSCALDNPREVVGATANTMRRYIMMSQQRSQHSTHAGVYLSLPTGLLHSGACDLLSTYHSLKQVYRYRCMPKQIATIQNHSHEFEYGHEVAVAVLSTCHVDSQPVINTQTVRGPGARRARRDHYIPGNNC